LGIWGKILKFLAIEGRVVDAIKQIRWDRHPLGSAKGWSPALRSNLYTILNSASPKIVLWGEELFTFYNDAYLELTQADPRPGIGAPYPEFRPRLWARVAAFVEAAMRGEGSIIQEFRTVPALDGGPAGVFQLCYSPLLDEDSKVGGVLIDIFDVTARRVAEENLLDDIALLNALFSTTPVLIAHASAPDLRLQYVNAAFSRMMGERPLIGRQLLEAIPEVEEQGFLPVLEQVKATGSPWEGREVPFLINGSGGEAARLCYLDFVYHPMHAADGSINGILFSGYDVSDRRRARDESERLRHELLHSSRMSAMGTMAVTIAHELNQPLTAAANYLSAAELFAQRDGAAGADLGPLRSARDQVLRAGSIVRRMRSLVECGHTRTDDFDLERSITRSIELVRASGNLEGFPVEVDIAPAARSCFGDEVQIEQVLVNLLRNAAEASARRSCRGAALNVDRDGDMIQVELRDWGPGLPAGRLENPFAGIDQPSRGSGLGVGLSLCRTIVEAHGGQMSARNLPDGGALFSFTLPASEPKARRSVA
jgi:two-component system sensor kinase FixL